MARTQGGSAKTHSTEGKQTSNTVAVNFNKTRKKEQIEEYAKRILTQLEELNAAYEQAAETNIREFYSNENEQLAKTVFEDGIYDKDLKMLVRAGRCSSLKEAIDYAQEQYIRTKGENPTPIF